MDPGRAEAEAILLSLFEGELDPVTGLQSAKAVHLDRAEVDPRVETVRKLGRGDRSPAFSGLKNLTMPRAMVPAWLAPACGTTEFEEGGRTLI